MASLSSQPPSPCSPYPSSTTSNRIYSSFCTAKISNWIECYNPSNNLWDRITTIPGLIENRVLKGFSMVSIGHCIYIIGGRLCQKLSGHEPDEIFEVNVEVLQRVLRYDVVNDVWSKCASLRVPRFDFACTVCDDKIYVAGGQSKLSCARGTASAEVYDPALDEWKFLPNMNTLRYKCVAVTWQGKIHVVGGFAENRDSDRKVTSWRAMERSSAEVYDWENTKWELIRGMWQLDVPPNQIVAVGDQLFSSGDCLNAWKGHIDAFDGNLNIWNEVDGSHLETLSSPISTSVANWQPGKRLYLTMAPIGAQLYFLAGYRMPGEISRSTCNVHVFDTSADGDAWTSLEPIEEEGEKELCGHCCALSQPQM
ncbi:influenza virus NS1A-binding protein homolog A-like [Mangifera indica]|uniref:influenza virus NS1A-binding protein homolog A-like n=1 Tax=Mangifera indica TaxID=29780 RepID=UPI001CF9E6CB|nr:influenza virus NS1A-binding protein homolog A-like [Mangifera indica]